MSHPKVFVSSTYVDLRGLRTQLETFIKKFGLTPVLFEKGGIYFDWTLPFDISCYNEIPHCDIYVLIIGGRYGSPASSETKKRGLGITKFNSVTKNEYRKAEEVDMPIFIFVDNQVLTTYKTYCRNGRKLDVEYAIVDNPLIFRLLDDIYSRKRNNFIQGYSSIEDITTFLRDQWAGMLHDYIQKKMRQKIGEKEIRINAYKLFYYRYSRSLSFTALSHLSGDREENSKA